MDIKTAQQANRLASFVWQIAETLRGRTLPDRRGDGTVVLLASPPSETHSGEPEVLGRVMARISRVR
jgi:hypothetical protein